jgi:hypothetical protein
MSKHPETYYNKNTLKLRIKLVKISYTYLQTGYTLAPEIWLHPIIGLYHRSYRSSLLIFQCCRRTLCEINWWPSTQNSLDLFFVSSKRFQKPVLPFSRTRLTLVRDVTLTLCIQLFQLRLSTSKAEKWNMSAKGYWEP